MSMYTTRVNFITPFQEANVIFFNYKSLCIENMWRFEELSNPSDNKNAKHMMTINNDGVRVLFAILHSRRI